ncbi:hypothetical protein GF389_03585 [Candidatus Dojkabacteria bacterium]|nr:hypothetical protein [Candidatus Dojkabacteria bacterium]
MGLFQVTTERVAGLLNKYCMRIGTSNMPKLHSPFKRSNIGGRYVCIPEIEEDYRWVFEDSIAVEKLDGTNVSVWIQDNQIKGIKNRENIIDIWSKGGDRFYNGVSTALQRGYFNPLDMKDGGHYGELIGSSIRANPYRLDGQVWVPFNHLLKKSEYRFWQDMLQNLKGRSDDVIYSEMSNLFKGLWSLYKRQRGFKDKPEVVTDNTGFEGLASEGIIFYSRDLKRMAKLRRDMFDWYKGKGHK